MEIKLIAKFIMRKLGYEVINLKHDNTGGGDCQKIFRKKRCVFMQGHAHLQ